MAFGLTRHEKGAITTFSLCVCVRLIIVDWYLHHCLRSESGGGSPERLPSVLNVVLRLGNMRKYCNLKFDSLLDPGHETE